MKKSDLEEQLDVIAAKAKTLRDAGILAICVGDVSIELAPRDLPEAVAPAKDGDDEDDADTPALNSRATFGGREVPGRRQVKDPDER